MMALAMLLASPSGAQTTAEPEGSRDGAHVSEFALDRLMARSEPVILRSAADRYAFYLPVSPRVEIRRATLELVYTNSISLLESRSQLTVQLNGKVLAQAPLRPREPEGLLRVNLPPELMEPGYNELAIQVAQHYVEQCEDPTAAELWTQIDAARTRLRFVYDDRPVEDDLASLPRMADPLGWEPYRITILTPEATLDDQRLAAGARIAAGVGTLLRYRPLQVAHDQAAVAPETRQRDVAGRTTLLAGTGGSDAALVGTAAELAPFLSPALAGEIDGPYLGMSRATGDPTRFVLIVSGRSPDEVAEAALAFALAGGSLPDAASMTVRQLDAPDLPRYAHGDAVSARQRYPLSSLGLQTTTLGGAGSDRFELDLWVPPDLFTPADSMLELHVHMAYGAGADPTSVVNVELNDRFASAIRLVSQDGGIFRDYVISIPASWLQPGRNTLRFRAYMTPMSEGDVCFTPSDAALLVTVFDDSWVLLTDARHHVGLPDLRLLSRTGFPYTSPADGSDLYLRVTDRSGHTAAAAWTLVGKLTQLGAVPPWRANIGSGPAGDGRHELVVGPVADLPADLMKGAPVEFGSHGLLRPEILSMPEGRPESRSIRSVFRAGSGLSELTPRTPALATVSYEASADGRAYILQFESPQSPGYLTTVVTAGSDVNLEHAVDRLVQHDLWGGLQGDLSSWTAAGDTVATATVGKRFHLGEMDLSSRASFFFTERPALWIGLLTVVVIVFVLTSVYLLRRRARRRT